MEDFLFTFLGAGIGGFIGVITTRFYYEKATQDLKIETEKLQFSNGIILRALNNAGLAQVKFDKDGNVIGLDVTVLASMAGEAKVKVSGVTVKTES